MWALGSWVPSLYDNKVMGSTLCGIVYFCFNTLITRFTWIRTSDNSQLQSTFTFSNCLLPLVREVFLFCPLPFEHNHHKWILDEPRWCLLHKIIIQYHIVINTHDIIIIYLPGRWCCRREDCSTISLSDIRPLTQSDIYEIVPWGVIPIKTFIVEWCL